MSSMLRSPIVSVLGHVDHGKSTLLDKIRGTDVAGREAGSITQSIGASEIPLETVRERSGALFDSLGDEVDLPGLLFIDTPGHEAFSGLRERGGSLADLAVLVIDVQDGVQPQTEEAMRILQASETPFVIAANKVDLVHGFDASNTGFLDAYGSQSDDVQRRVDDKVYELIGDLHEHGVTANRFDDVDDYRESFAIVPCSAERNVGLGEILFVLVGLAQRFLTDDLSVHPDEAGRGIILEVKEEQGMGKTLDTILYDGYITEDDTVMIGSLDGPMEGRIRGLFMPKALSDSRDEKASYERVDKAVAATGVKILSPAVDDAVVSGMRVEAVRGEEVDAVRDRVDETAEDLDIEYSEEGVVIKADTLGGLEALASILEENDVPVRSARVGDVSKKDVVDAQSSLERSPEYAVVLGFNVDGGVSGEGVGVYTSNVVYELVHDAEGFIEEKREEADRERLRKLTPPAKARVLDNCVFRKSDPCIVGVEVLAGVLHTNSYVMDEHGEKLGMVKSIQEENENVSRAVSGDQVAVNISEGDAEDNVQEGMLIYTDLLEDEFREYKDLSHLLNEGLKRVIKEVARVKREDQPLWGV